MYIYIYVYIDFGLQERLEKKTVQNLKPFRVIQYMPPGATWALGGWVALSYLRDLSLYMKIMKV